MKSGIVSFILFCFFSSYRMPGKPIGCSALVVKDIRLDIDQTQLSITPDTVTMLVITVKNTCAKCKQNGPDYCPLRVYDSDGNLLARDVINGIPEYKEERVYFIHTVNRMKKLPPLKTLRVSLEGYCDKIKIRK